jgi:hypothetical protein
VKSLLPSQVALHLYCIEWIAKKLKTKEEEEEVMDG